MALKLTVENYRGLRKVDCEVPSGLSVVVGPNGSGKTTFLTLPSLFCAAFEHGWSSAVHQFGGHHEYKHVAAPGGQAVVLRMEHDGLFWQVTLDGSVPGLQAPAEQARFGGPVGRRAIAGGDVISAEVNWGPQPQSVVRVLVDRAVVNPAALGELLETRAYTDLLAAPLRVHGSQYSADTFLHPSGQNLLTVLRTWKDKLANRPRQEFVIHALREAFPGFHDLEFEATSNVVDARVVRDASGREPSLPLRTASNGFLHAMLCLTAVASAPDGGLVTIDEPETALHPYAIRRVIDAMREWADDHDIDVVLATHSPIVIDAMHDTPEQVLVFSPAEGPKLLTEMHDAAYLARFMMGDLYAESRLGGPNVAGRLARGEPGTPPQALPRVSLPRETSGLPRDA